MPLTTSAGPSVFDALLTSTMQEYRPKLIDNVYDSIPFFWWIAGSATKGTLAPNMPRPAGGNRVETYNGGESIRINLLYSKNNTAGSFEGFDAINVDTQQPFTAAQALWKQVAASVTLDVASKLKNRGRSAVFKYLEALVKNAEMALRDELNRLMFTDGTGNDSKDITGLLAAVANTPTSGTYQGINRATYDWWRNQYYANAGSFATNGRTRMRAMYSACSRGQSNDTPDLILCDEDNYLRFEAALEPLERITIENQQNAANIGFEALRFKRATMMWDAQMDSQNDNAMYFLNTRYIELSMMGGANFEITPFARPFNQLASTAIIHWMGNLTFSNCARQGVITGFTD